MKPTYKKDKYITSRNSFQDIDFSYLTCDDIKKIISDGIVFSIIKERIYAVTFTLYLFCFHLWSSSYEEMWVERSCEPRGLATKHTNSSSTWVVKKQQRDFILLHKIPPLNNTLSFFSEWNPWHVFSVSTYYL